MEYQQPGLYNPNPIIGVVSPNRPSSDTKNCEELKRLSDDAAYKASFEDLRDNKLSDNREHGYSFKKNGQGVQPPEALAPGPVNISNISIPTGGFNYGASHSHPDNGETMPMFSGEDVLVFYNLIKNYNYGGTPGSPLDMRHTFVYTVTTINGTYALKVDNAMSIGLMTQYFSSESNQRDFIIALKYKQKSKDTSDSAESFELQFLKFIQSKNIGVALYRADESLDNWSKLTIDPVDSDEVKKTKC